MPDTNNGNSLNMPSEKMLSRSCAESLLNLSPSHWKQVLDKGTAEGIKVQTRSSWHGKGSDFLMDKLFRMHVALVTL